MLKQSYLLTILAAFLLVFTSCSKDKDPEPSLESRVSNKEWTLTAQTIKVGSSQPEDIMEDILDEFDVSGVSFELDGNGGYTIMADGNTEEGEYEIDGDKLIWNYPGTYTWLSSEEDIHEYTISLTGNTLKLTSNTSVQGQNAVEVITFEAD